MPDRVPTESTKTKPFAFQSYGVRIVIEGSHQDLIDDAESVARSSLLGNVHRAKGKRFEHRFELSRLASGSYVLRQNGKRIAGGRSRKKFLKFFDAIIRVTVGASAEGFVFMHAGVVGWRGKAIVLPADSFKGKSTLVSELVKKGAVYYSDEFAVFDGGGLVHPFARPVSLRKVVDGSFVPYEIEVENIGGTIGTKPIPVGCIIFTEYKERARWTPDLLTCGQGLLKMVPYALSLTTKPDFTMAVLNKVATRATIASGLRSNARNFAKTLLDFVDKHVN